MEELKKSMDIFGSNNEYGELLDYKTIHDINISDYEFIELTKNFKSVSYPIIHYNDKNFKKFLKSINGHKITKIELHFDEIPNIKRILEFLKLSKTISFLKLCYHINDNYECLINCYGNYYNFEKTFYEENKEYLPPCKLKSFPYTDVKRYEIE